MKSDLGAGRPPRAPGGLGKGPICSVTPGQACLPPPASVSRSAGAGLEVAAGRPAPPGGIWQDDPVGPRRRRRRLKEEKTVSLAGGQRPSPAHRRRAVLQRGKQLLASPGVRPARSPFPGARGSPAPARGEARSGPAARPSSPWLLLSAPTCSGLLLAPAPVWGLRRPPATARGCAASRDGGSPGAPRGPGSISWLLPGRPPARFGPLSLAALPCTPLPGLRAAEPPSGAGTIAPAWARPPAVR